MVFAISTGWWAVVAQLATSISAFALSLVLAHLVNKEAYGTYQYILSIMSMLSILTLTGIGNAVTQSVARGHDQSLQDGFRLNMRWSFGVLVGTGALVIYYVLHQNYALGIAILIAGLTTPLRTSFNLYGSFLGGKKDNRRSALYTNGIGNVAPMIMIALAAFFTNSGVLLAIAYSIGNLVTAAYLYIRTIRDYQPLARDHDSDLRSYSFHLSAAGILNTVAGNLDNLLLFHYLGPTDVAIYNFAIALPDQTKGPLGSVGTMLTARFAGHSPEAIHGSMRNKIKWLAIIHVLMVALLIIIIPPFYHFFFSTYTASIPYAQLYTLSLLATIFMPMSAYLTAHKHVREQYLYTIFSSVFQIGALFVGVLTAGLLGIVIARIVARIISWLVLAGLYRNTVARR